MGNGPLLIILTLSPVHIRITFFSANVSKQREKASETMTVCGIHPSIMLHSSFVLCVLGGVTEMCGKISRLSYSVNDPFQ